MMAVDEESYENTNTQLEIVMKQFAIGPNTIYFLRRVALKCTMRPQTTKESKKLSHRGAFDAC